MKIYLYQHTVFYILGPWEKRERPISLKGEKIPYKGLEVKVAAGFLITTMEA